MTRFESHITSRLAALSVLLLLIISGCGAPTPPRGIDNICDIFSEYPKWYRAAYGAYQRWGIPIPVLMAIMHQESGFRARVKPPRTKCLFIFPGPRPSSAYGYAQALDATWESYITATGKRGAKRSNFADAVDFVGWYGHVSHQRCGIAKHDARNLYLAYHEGQGGYNRGTFRQKAWLINVADRVQRRATMYANQLAGCEDRLRKPWWRCLWPL
jgi:hypothetical protein